MVRINLNPLALCWLINRVWIEDLSSICNVFFCNDFKMSEKGMHFLCVYIFTSWLVSAWSTRAEAPSVTAFGNRVLKEAIHVQWDHEAGALSGRTAALAGGGRDARGLAPSMSLCPFTHRAAAWTPREPERPHQKPAVGAPGSWLLASSYEKRNLCCLSHLFPGIFYGSLSRLHTHARTHIHAHACTTVCVSV